MVDKIIGQSISNINPKALKAKPFGPKPPNFMDTLQKTFELATKNLDRKELPGSDGTVYIPKAQNIAPFNITDISIKNESPLI